MTRMIRDGATTRQTRALALVTSTRTMLGKALKLQALMMALVAASCVVEDGVAAIGAKISRCAVRDVSLALMSHHAANAAKGTKKALAEVFLMMHAFSLFDVYARGNAMCPTKLSCAAACVVALACGLYGGALPLPKIGGGKKKKAPAAKKASAPKRTSSRSSSRSSSRRR